jgi:DNA-binding response OmpR family regulator
MTAETGNQGQGPNGRAKRVLVVDDDQLVRTTAKTILERAGYTVSVAGDGNGAIAEMSREEADLVVLDIIMPDKEGIETLLHLKRDHPGVKVIAISSGGRKGIDDFLMIAHRFGADAALKKPIRPQVLLAQAANLLNGEPATAGNPSQSLAH